MAGNYSPRGPAVEKKTPFPVMGCCPPQKSRVPGGDTRCRHEIALWEAIMNNGGGYIPDNLRYHHGTGDREVVRHNTGRYLARCLAVTQEYVSHNPGDRKALFVEQCLRAHMRARPVRSCVVL